MAERKTFLHSRDGIDVIGSEFEVDGSSSKEGEVRGDWEVELEDEGIDEGEAVENVGETEHSSRRLTGEKAL